MLLTALDLDVVSSAGISISDCGGSKEGVAVDGVAVALLEVWIWACDGWQTTGFFEFFICNEQTFTYITILKFYWPCNFS